MTPEQTAEQLELAAKILRTGHPWETSHTKERWWLATSADDPGVHVVNNQHIRLALATPPDGRPLHNPDNLDAEQVGAGYRLLLPVELDGRHKKACEVWSGKNDWSGEHLAFARYKLLSYRLPLSIPWPEVEKPDPYAELKAAHAAGKVVQVIDCGRWLDLPTPNWCEPVGRYRIKPTESAPAEEPAFTLPPPPPGLEWHRTTDWKPGDLPQGYRPLAKGEAFVVGKDGDEYRCWDGSFHWQKREPNQHDTTHCRTTRPLVFEHAGKSWTWHRAGDPCPCDTVTRIDVLMDDGYICLNQYVEFASTWESVIGWRYAEPQTKTVPLGPEDVRCGDEVQDSAGEARVILHVTRSGAFIYGLGFYSFEALADCLKIRRRDSSEFVPCSKTIPA